MRILYVEKKRELFLDNLRKEDLESRLSTADTGDSLAGGILGLAERMRLQRVKSEMYPSFTQETAWNNQQVYETVEDNSYVQDNSNIMTQSARSEANPMASSQSRA